MKNISLVLLVLFLTLLISPDAFAQSQKETFGLSLEYWMTNFEGEARSSGGTDVKLVEDIDVSDSDSTIKINFTLPVTAGSALDLSYYSLSYSGSAEITKSITFNDVIYPVGTLTAGTADANIFDVKYRLFPFASGGAELGVILGFKFAQAEASLSSEAQGKTKANLDIPLPQIGVVLKSDFQYIRLYGELSGFALSYQDSSGSMFELDVRAEYDFLSNAGVILGYRYYNMDLEQKGDGADFTINGPYLGGIYRF